MKRIVLPLILVALAIAGVFIYRTYFTSVVGPQVMQAEVTEGDITQAAISTGTLSALRTVDIGTQVSGTVVKLNVDFNSIVHKGEVIAKLDPAPSEQDLQSAVAARDKAKIDLQEEQDALDLDQKNLDRIESLYSRTLETETDREQAALQVKEDQAQIRQDEAAIAIADANVKQSQVDLDYCTITSPIDGVVISRNVDEGQTVSSRLAAPTLYVLATDLTQLQIVADVDESDVSRIRAGQTVDFTVDAYPGRTFHGTVTIVRLNATNNNNVVTYQVVASVDNPDLRLMPGMTSTLGIELWRSQGVVRVPSAALRFRPIDDVFAELGQPIPAEAHLKPAPPKPQPPKNVVTNAAIITKAGSTVDQFFEPLERPTTSGTVWMIEDRQLKPVSVKLGITDGTWTEVLDNTLQPGDQVVTNILLPATLHKPAAPANNPLMPPSRGATPPRPNGR
jgi:HlyD family secretion protein